MNPDQVSSTNTIDLSALVAPAPPVAPELRAEVDCLAADVEAAARQLAPLLEQAIALLTEVDRQVCRYALEGAGIEDEDDRYELAARMSGHDRLFDALQRLSAKSDAFAATADHHPVEQHWYAAS